MAEPTVWDALNSGDFWKSTGQGFTDAVNRGVIGSTLGGPVDMATLALNSGIAGLGYVGHKTGILKTPPALIENPVGGSEWFGKKMQDAGLVSGNRNQLAEGVATAFTPVVPAAAQKVSNAVASGAKALGPALGDALDAYAQKTGMQLNAVPGQTVRNAQRIAYPGVYKAPEQIVAEAKARVAPESPLLKQLFGVTRGDLYDMSLRAGNEPGVIPGAALNPKGSAAADGVMVPENAERLVKSIRLAKQLAPELYQPMHAWYTMDPQYQRMVELMGRDAADAAYQRLNAFGGIESPNMPVDKEFVRATSANWLGEQGRWGDWMKYGGLDAESKARLAPPDMAGVPGRVGHDRASNTQNKFLLTGEHGMDSPKAPPYIQASSVPEHGFQTDTPVGDAHFIRALGLADTRTNAGYGESISTPELQAIKPWFTQNISGATGMENVPAQAVMWGLYSPQTGVKTAIGAPKLELHAIEIGKAAQRLGVSPEVARDMILTGEARAGR